MNIETKINLCYTHTLALTCKLCHLKKIEVQIHRKKRKVEEIDISKSVFKVEIKKLYNKIYRCRKKKKRVEGYIVDNQVKPATSTVLSLKMTSAQMLENVKLI